MSQPRGRRSQAPEGVVAASSAEKNSTLRRAIVVAVVVLATLAGAVAGLAVLRVERDLDVGTVGLSVDPGRHGALDLYVPVVDWGVRFPVVRLPARVNVDVRSVDRDAVVELAQTGRLNAAVVRAQARDALASFLRLAIAVAVLSGLAFGALVAVAVRGGAGPPLPWTLAIVAVTALAAGVVLAIGLPPRSNVGNPQYYANGPEVPAALRTLESLGPAARTLDDEIDEQLVGIARLVNAPAGRVPIVPTLPRLTVASDLHNNILAMPALERAARGRPLLLVGDLTDRGSPVESDLVVRIAHAGRPVVFVAGNHDSDALERKLARAGVVVLTRRGRLHGNGRTSGPQVVRVAGLRIAGYDDPFKRLSREGYADNGAMPTAAEQEPVVRWLQDVRDEADILMIHSPLVAALAVEQLRADPPSRPQVVVWGHTHRPALERAGNLTFLNPGSVGAGGTGNLHSGGGDVGLARMTYRIADGFEPLAADLVEIDPGDGTARAERLRLDEPSPAQ